ncbi:hypothetical protein [Singulisphaera sp. PoT]|uniref:hypothetical protein n=1 Tax=Singulisphaera sp. PoT TaxID=3411797 RepID=UPI003BF5F8C6
MSIVATLISAIVTYLKGSLLAQLDGYKTYMGVAGLVLLAAWELYAGDFTLFAALALNSFTLFGIRHAIDKLTPPASS